MIGIAKLKSAAQATHYYEKDDYYMRSDHLAPSQWSGDGAKRLGLKGEVDRDVFAEALQGSLPKGVELPRNDDGHRDVGLDLSFNAPKSVSLMALVAGDERLLAAHREAVARGLEYFEANAAVARVTKQRVTAHEATGNLLVAQFHHDTSRELDPHLHTHAVVLNATQRTDGEWRALTNSAFYDLRHTADTIYRTELAARVQALGYDVERTRADGQFEIGGCTREDLMRFSKRREAILASLEERGEGGAEAAQRAALITRASKKEVDRTELRKVWRTEVAAYDVRLPQARRARGADRSPSAQRRAQEAATQASRHQAKRAVLHALEHLTERSAVVPERELVKHALQAKVGYVVAADHVFEAIRGLAEDAALVAVRPERAQSYDQDNHWTTEAALHRESQLVGLVGKGKGAVGLILEPQALWDALDGRQDRAEGATGPRLTEGQLDALTVALTTPDRVVGVQGYAGTGKTTALQKVRELAEGQGYTVRGFAPSAAAAQVLEQEAGIESRTLASHLLRRPEGRADKEVWVVDEVSMMGNRTALQLLRAAEARGARVVLVGDKEQLPSIEAGRVFRLLTERGMRTATMDEVLRQKDPGLKQAVLQTIDHRSKAALDLLDDRVRVVSSRKDRLRAVAKDYLDAGPERPDTLVLTPSNADRVELNAYIRQGLRQDGVLVGDEHPAEVLAGRGLTKAQTVDSSQYAVGDVVRFGRAYRGLGVDAGDSLAVTAVNTETNIVTLQGAGGREFAWRPHLHRKVEAYRSEVRYLSAGDRIRWTRNDNERGRRNGEYADVLEVTADGKARVRVGTQEQVLDLARERHWDHGYAVTAHAAQGQTRGKVLVHIDTSQRQLTGHEQWYVSISRAKTDLTIYTDDADRLPGRISRSMQQESALDARQRHRRSWDFQRQLDGL